MKYFRSRAIGLARHVTENHSQLKLGISEDNPKYSKLRVLRKLYEG